MTINLKIPDIREMKPRITVFGVGGAGGNAVNNMIAAGLQGVDFVVANTDAQALTLSKAERIVQMGTQEEATKAITDFNGKELDGRALTVNEAKPREERPRGDFGGGGGGRGGKREFSRR